jgi:hypothetical protein
MRDASELPTIPPEPRLSLPQTGVNSAVRGIHVRDSLAQDLRLGAVPKRHPPVK